MKKQKCKYCESYNPYYIKHIYNYSRTKTGYCNNHNKEKSQSEICDNYKSINKEKIKESLLLGYLEQSLKSINSISQILADKENKET